MLDAVGFSDRLEAFPGRLSGGEQQRVAIARALINGLLLLLADESAGNLVDETGKQVLVLFDRLTHHAGKNMIIITQSHEAAAYAGRILYLKDGKLHAAYRLKALSKKGGRSPRSSSVKIVCNSNQ